MSNELITTDVRTVEEGVRRMSILLCSNKGNQNIAEDLKSILGEWANVEIWENIFGNEDVEILTMRRKFLDFDISIIMLTTDVVDILNGKNMQLAKDNLLFEVAMSYSYLGKRNSIIVVDKINGDKSSAALSLLEPSAFLYHDFTLPMDTLASKIEQYCNENMNRFNNVLKSNLPATSRLREHYVKVEMNRSKSLLAFSNGHDYTRPPNVEIEGNVLKRYLFPTNYGDKENTEVEIVLVERDGTALLTDQGKTIMVLDQIFELGEPDVIKNLVAIMKQHNTKKVGKEIIIELATWFDNPVEDENFELREAIYRLYACVMFMATMKIFYV